MSLRLPNISECRRCDLQIALDRSIVSGEGVLGARVMFIGEAPGRKEDDEALLRRIIKALDLEGDVYITNVVKCRPPNNRNPEYEEVIACRPYLREEVREISPKIIVVLGRIAAESLDILQSGQRLDDVHDIQHAYLGIPTYVTYHPAARYRNIGNYIRDDICAAM